MILVQKGEIVEKTDVMMLIGTTGEIYPASHLSSKLCSSSTLSTAKYLAFRISDSLSDIVDFPHPKGPRMII